MPRLEIKKDDVSKILASITRLSNKQVLVGIPEDETQRNDPEATNALIGYAMEFGLPEQNVPARPTLIPGVQKALPQALEQMREAAKATMSGQNEVATKFLTAAGMLAANSVKNEINTGDFLPLSPKTIANRFKARRTQTMRQSEIHYLALVAAGMPPEGAQAATGIRPLVNTGQFRNAVTSVVRRRS